MKLVLLFFNSTALFAVVKKEKKKSIVESNCTENKVFSTAVIGRQKDYFASNALHVIQKRGSYTETQV